MASLRSPCDLSAGEPVVQAVRLRPAAISLRSPYDLPAISLQVNQSFKRCVFVPLRKAGVGGTLAALLTFIASGMLHGHARSAPPTTPCIRRAPALGALC